MLSIVRIALPALLVLGLPPEARAQTASADSILAVARILTGETGMGPPSRFAPLPSTGDYVEWLRAELDRRLRPLGGNAVVDTFHPGLDYDGPEAVREVYANVVGFVPGVLGLDDPCFMVGAHLDATAQRDDPGDGSFDPFTAPAPGADDNASGVCVVLELARVMAARGMRPQADLFLVLFDGEEQQLIEPDRFLLGSKHLAAEIASGAGKTLYGLVNLDMVAYHPEGRDSLVIVTNTRSRWLADRLLDAHRRPLEGGSLVESLALERLVKGLTYSDHAPFWEEGYDAVLLIEDPEIVAYAPHYHKATDTVANTYTNGGSQVRAATDLVLRLVDTWTLDPQAAAPALEVTTEDILVQRGSSVDLAKALVGETVTVNVGFTNQGGTFDGTAAVELRVETVDGDPLETVGRLEIPGVLPAGGRERASFAWTVSEASRGAVDLVAVVSGAGEPRSARRGVAVESATGDIVRAFVYPNPTRDPKSAVFHYELAKGGAVRLSVIDTGGRRVSEIDISFDPVFPDPGTATGAAEVPLDEVLEGRDLAPGLYIARVELFGAEGEGSVSVAFSRFAVLR